LIGAVQHSQRADHVQLAVESLRPPLVIIENLGSLTRGVSRADRPQAMIR
jgi:hypothetical protein